MNDAKDGVIYFSMGSNMKSEDLFLNIFGELKQTVWKLENASTDIPENVHLLKSAQQSILGEYY